MNQISFHPDWQIHNDFFNKPIMTRNIIRVNPGGSQQGFLRCFADGLNQSLVSSVAQANLIHSVT